MADTTIGYHFGSHVATYDLAPCADCHQQEEELLVEGLQAGENEAYEALISQFQQPVYNLVHRLLMDTSDTCDVVQDVFLKVFRNIGSFRRQSSLKTWIYRIAVNEAHNQRRWFTRHRRQEVGLESDEERNRNYQETLCDSSRSPFEETLSHETRALIERALAQLNPTFRAAVVLRDIEGLSYEEIADVLQVSLGTVKSRILRGREALRKTLAGQLEPGPAWTWAPQPALGPRCEP